MAMKIVEHAFEIIYLTTDANPLQVVVDAIANSGAREDSTRVGGAGVARRQAVDVSPLRRVNQVCFWVIFSILWVHLWVFFIYVCFPLMIQAIALLTAGARQAAFRSVKTISECLADELIHASRGSPSSYAIKKKDELERVAKSNVSYYVQNSSCKPIFNNSHYFSVKDIAFSRFFSVNTPSANKSGFSFSNMLLWDKKCSFSSLFLVLDVWCIGCLVSSHS